MTVDLKANEMVIKAGDSKHLIGDEKIEGKLIITNQRIYFISHDETTDHANREILPGEIVEVIYINGSNLFSKGLNVVTKNGDNMRFLVKKRNEFGQLINKMY